MTAELWLHKPHPDKAEHVGCCVTLDPDRVVPGFRKFDWDESMGLMLEPTVQDIIDALTGQETDGE